MVQIACDNCTIGVMDSTNPHLHDQCPCPCHKRKWGCKDPNCGISTGFGGEATFGKGELGYYGYWEIPCYECARVWEKLYPEEGPCWPFEEETVPGAFLRI